MSNEKKASQKNEEITLPPRQAEVLKFIQETLVSLGSPPSYREIQKHFKFKSIKTVQDHLKALTKKGKLVSIQNKKTKRLSRNLIPHNHRPERVKRISIYGEIAAGSPREAEQLEMGSLLIPEEMSPAPCFALKVVGTSMIDAGILEGDVLIVEKTQVAKNGDIVVALLEGETTVKKFFKEREKISLIPENKNMKPIVVATQNFEIQGKVIGLQRSFYPDPRF